MGICNHWNGDDENIMNRGKKKFCKGIDIYRWRKSKRETESDCEKAMKRQTNIRQTTGILVTVLFELMEEYFLIAPLGFHFLFLFCLWVRTLTNTKAIVRCAV